MDSKLALTQIGLSEDRSESLKLRPSGIPGPGPGGTVLAVASSQCHCAATEQSEPGPGLPVGVGPSWLRLGPDSVTRGRRRRPACTHARRTAPARRRGPAAAVAVSVTPT
jgi:hypothetical protein